ncbi:MAG: hypothetical protein R3330_05025, partial [Saprospiraceae bacterium]|nr:hypothetical protein [Saprospiraceae bacterium]
MKLNQFIPALCVLILAVHPANATTFIFSGATNGTWSEPSNWSPGYPGVVILEGDEVVIQAECSILSHDVVNHGGITISVGTKLIVSG